MNSPAEVAGAMAAAGCSPEQIAATLTKLEGIKSAQLRRERNQRYYQSRVLKRLTPPSEPVLQASETRLNSSESETPLARVHNLALSLESKEVREDKPSLRSGSSTVGPNGHRVDPPRPNGEPNLFVLVEPCRAKLVARQESDQAVLDRVTDVWNQWAAAHGSPQVRYLTGQRAAHCRRRLADLKFDDGEAPETAFGRLLSKCETSFFVRGSPRSPLKFDQLMQEGFLVKMMEGTFEWQNKKMEFQNRASRY